LIGIVKEIAGAVIAPLAQIVTNRQERKAATEQAAAKLVQSKQDGARQVLLKDQEIEAVLASGLGQTWKDEYVTVSLVSIINLLVIGGIAAAFGHGEVLQGLSIALQAIVAAGVNIGFLLEATVLAAIGLNVWRKA